MDESYVELYAGTDMAGAIQLLVGVADPTARARCSTAQFHVVPADLAYPEDTDWMAAADEMAAAIGMKLHKIADVWVLAPRLPDVHVHIDGVEIRRVVAAEVDKVMSDLAASISKVAG